VGDTCVDEGSVVLPDEDPDGDPDGGTDAGALGQDIVVTGAGGCAGCTVADGREGSAAWPALILLSIAGLVGLRRRQGA